MSKTIVATKQSELSNIVDSIHDCFFDIGSVRFDAADKTVTIPFRRDRTGFTARALGAGDECLLIIGTVESFSLEDRIGVRYYDFNEIEFDSARRVLTIKTGMPLDFTVKVEVIQLSIKETGRKIEYK